MTSDDLWTVLLTRYLDLWPSAGGSMHLNYRSTGVDMNPLVGCGQGEGEFSNIYLLTGYWLPSPY